MSNFTSVSNIARTLTDREKRIEIARCKFSRSTSWFCVLVSKLLLIAFFNRMLSRFSVPMERLQNYRPQCLNDSG